MSDGSKSAMDGGFGKYVPGFEFLQNLAGQGEGAKASLANLGNWVAPTFNVEDLDKRIQELKAVQFWLDQNAKALAATIQALEVQRMTLTTLKTMNLSMGDVAQSIGAMVGVGAQAEAAPAPAPTAFAGLEIPPRTYGNSPAPAASQDEDDDDATEDEAEDAPAAQGSNAESGRAKSGSAQSASAPAAGAVDPMQWWGALTQQFQQIAASALQSASHPMVPGAGDAPVSGGPSAVPPQARASAASEAPARKSPARKAPAKKPATKKTGARSASSKQPASASSTRARKTAAPQSLGGDWPMPTAFFQMPGFPGMGEPAAKKSTSAKKPAGGSRKPAAKKAAPRKAAPASRRR